MQHQLNNTPLAEGTYEFFVKQNGEETVSYLRLSYSADSSGNFAQNAPMEISTTSPYRLVILKQYWKLSKAIWDVDWVELISNATTKSVPPRDYTMILTVPETDYEIIGAFATASIPEYILN